MSGRNSYLTFAREVNGVNRIITIREFPDQVIAAHSYVLTVEIPFTADGSSYCTPQESNLLYKVEEAIEKILKPQGAFLVGHILEPGRGLIIYRSHRPAPANVEVKTGLLSKKKFDLNTREDRDAIWHKTEIAPTLRERHFGLNLPLHNTLQQHGDNATAVRPVDYTFSFRTEANRTDALHDLGAQGYLLNSEGKWTADDGSLWCSVVRSSNVEPEEMVDRCIALAEIAERHQGSFDGWACPIVQ